MNWKEIQELKVGDDVAVRPAYEHQLYTFHKITKVTKTQITLDDDSRFNRNNGDAWGRGDSWRSSSLDKVEQAEKMNISIRVERRQRVLANKISLEINSSTSIEKLESIVKILGVNE